MQNIAGRSHVGCHNTVEDFDHWNVRPEIGQLLADLAAEFVRLAIRKSGDDFYAEAGTFPATWPRPS